MTAEALARLNAQIAKRLLGLAADLPDGTTVLVTVAKIGGKVRVRTAEMTGEETERLHALGFAAKDKN